MLAENISQQLLGFDGMDSISDIVPVTGSIEYNKRFFTFEKYISKGRWVSYWNQLNEVLSETSQDTPSSCLIIGCGDNIVPDVLKKFGVEAVTFDYSKDLEPDICGDIREILSILGEDKKFDFILCCQVLEHLEYTHFLPVLKQLSKLAKRKVIISLPQQASYLEFRLKVPKFPEIDFYKLIFRSWIKEFRNNEHYWEIGIKGYPLNRIRNDLYNCFRIEKEFTDPIFKYHRFFILLPII
ncbi:MAG: class I SAM-dependent methyltransferase [Chitinispirillales bacterium]|jgi:hypothetical protein|nr:class I SAM-dependent methyltransferase [Chitinispirillales bacterium]